LRKEGRQVNSERGVLLGKGVGSGEEKNADKGAFRKSGSGWGFTVAGL